VTRRELSLSLLPPKASKKDSCSVAWRRQVEQNARWHDTARRVASGAVPTACARRTSSGK